MAREALPRRVAGAFRRGGVGGLVLAALGHTVLRRVILIERDLSQPVRPVPCDVEFRMALLRPEDTDAYIEYRPDRTRDELSRRLERGSVCYVAWIDGRIVSDCWYHRGEAWVEDVGRRFGLEPDEAYAYDSHTTVALRGHSVTPSRAALALAHLRENGVRRAVAFVLPENAPARRSPVKSGWTPFGAAGWLRLGVGRVDFVRTDFARTRYCVGRRRVQVGSTPPLEPGGLLAGADGDAG